MRYAVIIEQGETSYGAYVPDLPGCVAVAETKDEVMSLIKDAIEFHLEDIKQEGQTVPVPSSFTEYIEVAACLARSAFPLAAGVDSPILRLNERLARNVIMVSITLTSPMK